MKEKLKRIKSKDIKSKCVPISEEEEHCVNWDGFPITEKTVDEWIKDLREFPVSSKEGESPLSIVDWLHNKKLYKRTFYYHLNKHPRLRLVYEDVLWKLGHKALDYHAKANFKALHHKLHTYGEDFIKMDEYQKKLKLEITEAIDAKLHTLSEEFIDTLKNMHGKI